MAHEACTDEDKWPKKLNRHRATADAATTNVPTITPTATTTTTTPPIAPALSLAMDHLPPVQLQLASSCRFCLSDMDNVGALIIRIRLLERGSLWDTIRGL